MNWKLILGLSMFGLVMAFATVFFIPGKVEIFVWLPIFIICAWIIAKRAPGNYFGHGFMVSLFNCIWIVAVHVVLYDYYNDNHKEEMHAMKNLPMYFHKHQRQGMIVVGPIFGIIFGLILGLFSWIASKVVKK